MNGMCVTVDSYCAIVRIASYYMPLATSSNTMKARTGFYIPAKWYRLSVRPHKQKHAHTSYSMLNAHLLIRFFICQIHLVSYERSAKIKLDFFLCACVCVSETISQLNWCPVNGIKSQKWYFYLFAHSAQRTKHTHTHIEILLKKNMWAVVSSAWRC